MAREEPTTPPDGTEVNLIGYYDQQVLAAYRNEPDKFVVEIDKFEGNLRVTDPYFRELAQAGQTNKAISVLFGFRTLDDGQLALAAFLRDLFEKSKFHLDRWEPFRLQQPQWEKGPDEPFDLWVRRYVQGDWDVENGVKSQLAEVMRTINGLTGEVLGVPLFQHEVGSGLCFPTVQNTHRYHDAHQDLYRYLIDGLDKSCVHRLVDSTGKGAQCDENHTVKRLKRALALSEDHAISTTAQVN